MINVFRSGATSLIIVVNQVEFMDYGVFSSIISCIIGLLQKPSLEIFEEFEKYYFQTNICFEKLKLLGAPFKIN